MSIPLLDIRSYYSNPDSFAKELGDACHFVGFFLLRHDIANNAADDMLQQAQQFFDRPLHEKLAISYENSRNFRGFMQMGVENTNGKMDAREQVEYAVETNEPNNEDDGPLYERLKGRNPWPDAFQPSLKPCTLKYVDEIRRIADLLREAMCLALGLDKHAMDHLFVDSTGQDPPHWVLKLVSYPPSSNENGFGVGPHTDTNFLTLVLQDNVGGLQVYSRGQWVEVPSECGSQLLVCNLGEQAQIVSGGYFVATPHRVLSSSRKRVSVPFFYNPKLSCTLKPMVQKHSKQPQEQEWKRNDAMLNTVGENTFKSLARSHPLVFQKYHSDLNLLHDGKIVRRSSERMKEDEIENE